MTNRKYLVPSLLLGSVLLCSAISASADSGPTRMMYPGAPGMMGGNMPGHMMNNPSAYGSEGCPDRGEMMSMGQRMMWRHGMMDNDMSMMTRHHMDGMGTRLDLVSMIDLDREQQKQLRKIQRELDKQRWTIMGQIMEEKNNLSDLYDTETRDPAAIDQGYGRIFDLKRKLIEANVVAGNQAWKLLNDEQRKQLATLEGQRGKWNMHGVRGMGGMMYQQ